MLNKLTFYTRVAYKILRKDVVNNSDYRKEYNSVARTYNYWLNQMSKYTDRIINTQLINEKENIKILDFACGTGYITRKLLEKGVKCEITAVDFSEGMLAEWKDSVDGRVKFVHGDGIEFLKNTREKYDVIFFGWALSYFNHNELFKLFKQVLNKDGLVCIITNTQGTLHKIEDIFLKVMGENPEEVIKPMEIKFNLPNGKEGLVRWFKKYGFMPCELGDGEEIISFNTPNELLEWLNKTGAAAGTAQIFKDYNKVKNKIIYEIKKLKYKNGKYEINHRFAYGIFKLYKSH